MQTNVTVISKKSRILNIFFRILITIEPYVTKKSNFQTLTPRLSNAPMRLKYFMGHTGTQIHNKRNHGMFK